LGDYVLNEHRAAVEVGRDLICHDHDRAAKGAQRFDGKIDKAFTPKHLQCLVFAKPQAFASGKDRSSRH
jgi:hypothetical protein